MQALIEMCTGNYLNQYSAFKVQVVDSVMNILRISKVYQSNEVGLEGLQIFTIHCVFGIFIHLIFGQLTAS